MKQFGSGLNLSTKKTRRREFLDEMERLVPWSVLVPVVEPWYPKAETGRPPFGIEAMLRIRRLQQWLALSDPAMKEALHEMPVFREDSKRPRTICASSCPRAERAPFWRSELPAAVRA